MKFDGFNDNSYFVDNVKSVSAPDDHTVAFELNKPNSRFHTKFLDRWGATWIMPKHIWESVEDPVTFEFNPFVGTGAYKLHSFDPAGFWTIWEKRADWDKSPTGMMFGEPKPKYIVFQYFANEGAKILAQLTHQADFISISSDGLKAMLQQCRDVPCLPAGVAVGREQRPGPDRHYLQHRQGAVRQQGRALGAAAGDRYRRLHGPGRRRQRAH